MPGNHGIQPLLSILFLAVYYMLPHSLSGQITGTVTNDAHESLPFVNIYVPHQQIGTTTNQEGNYILNIAQTGEYQITFQYLGYAKKEMTVSVKSLPYILDVTLTEESTTLDEVVVDGSVNPANEIIRKTIDQKPQILQKIEAFTADFYSRGMWKVKDAPERILGQDVGDLGGNLDSTRTGIVYLSETISKIAFRAPDDFKETISASKVSGDDNGFSFNSAQEANFSFYENTLELNTHLVSPLADNAFGYYDYTLKGSFRENGKLINKINVIPKRPQDRVFFGTLYIVEDEWQLYGLQLHTTGAAIQIPFVESLLFTQNFKYDSKLDLWHKTSQVIDFSFDLFGVHGDGRFNAVYSNYNFNPAFDRDTFTPEILSFAKGANKKDSLYWQRQRLVPLTLEERQDYIKKDSLQEIRSSKPYLDSIDARANRYNVGSAIFGYTYKNSYDRWQISIDGLLNNLVFNTIQGWNLTTGLRYAHWDSERYEKVFNASAKANYGFVEDKLRFTGEIAQRFNRRDRLTLSLSGGRRVQQFNPSNPITPLGNTSLSLFFGHNYLKAYDLTFSRLGYRQEVINGLVLTAGLNYEQRKPLFNNTSETWVSTKNRYTSNNPLAPLDFGSPAFPTHTIWRARLSARINFGQKYMSYPDGKFNIPSEKYPTLTLTSEHGFGANRVGLSFTQFSAQLQQDFDIGNKGNLGYNIKAGTFLDAEDISFVDYQHFDGNKTRIALTSRYLNRFNLLPYYDFSTNSTYFEGHAEHNFKGFILGKIPGLNLLNYNLILGGHALLTSQQPYYEFSVGLDNLGFGKYRFFRIDYTRSISSVQNYGAVIFGLQFLNLFL